MNTEHFKTQLWAVPEFGEKINGKKFAIVAQNGDKIDGEKSSP